VEKDFRAAVERLSGEPQEKLAFKLEMVAGLTTPASLVRSI